MGAARESKNLQYVALGGGRGIEEENMGFVFIDGQT